MRNDRLEARVAGQQRKRVVVVDDSETIRKWLRVVLETDGRLEVIGEAATAHEARKVIRETNPDVVTLDIEMPGMNGLDFLEKLMQLKPLPVVMISGATQANSVATITALSLGAVDCVLKPTNLVNAEVTRDITRRVFAAACSTVQVLQKPSPPVRAAPYQAGGAEPIVLIGASTGGVGALEVLLPALPADGPPVVVVQHMPGAFLVSFAQMLNRKLAQDVGLARDGEVLSRGQIRLAPAMGEHTAIKRLAKRWHCSLTPEPAGMLHCPAVDVLFASAVPVAKQVVAVILTGLGKDGTEGLRELHAAGATTLGQDESTSVVYGMPRAAWEAGAVGAQFPLARLGNAVNDAVADLARRKD